MSNLQQRWSAALMNNYGTPPIALVSGQGARVEDETGKSYIDMLAGIAVNSLGHAHPGVVAAVSQQIATLGHASNLMATGPVVSAGEKLIKRVGVSSARVLFVNSGAEANEAAVKLARLTGRSRVLAAKDGFHGRTMGALSVTGQPGKRKAFEPLPAGAEFFPFGDIDYLTQLVEINPSDTAAIFLEPIQGETGVIPAPPGFLQAVRALCDEHGILMVVDEVQTGAGRTGTFFAYEHSGVVPDVITMAKGLGAGLPIGACIGVGKAAQLFTPGSHGTTFGGNPVACAAANVVLETIDEEFLAEVARKGAELKELVEHSPHVEQVRGAGLMLGVVLKQPVAKQAVEAALQAGVIANAIGKDVIRLTPPLVIEDADIAQAANTLTHILQQMGTQ
ncbi:acetylornithine aminotransferase [Corynebacterium phocae]|uniref:Acetylornithine aminotransferase n=1 Tax=Corynebacterium phocae TaxID=161895 RepID=A0A1L7D3D7_9CORY|nr:acetylornithine transaminase [Corynebacterium phocae]APT92587.1 acetylornithine aminotransferase [Corynebacterium phocae]KAA8724142.1 acetylornithine transaminase [Corynebacterium phocae]